MILQAILEHSTTNHNPPKSAKQNSSCNSANACKCLVSLYHLFGEPCSSCFEATYGGILPLEISNNGLHQSGGPKSHWPVESKLPKLQIYNDQLYLPLRTSMRISGARMVQALHDVDLTVEALQNLTSLANVHVRVCSSV